MIIPIEIKIQAVDESGKSANLANILFGLKIFTGTGSWHNFSFFKTDVAGTIHLTRQRIIDNTELKHANYIESEVPTRFELYVWDSRMTSDFIETTKRLLDRYKDEESIRKDLLSKGIIGNSLTATVKAVKEKGAEDQALYEEIKDAVNANIQFKVSRISDTWLNASPKRYEFTVM